MAETNFSPRLGEIFEVPVSQVNLFRGISSPGYAIGDIAITSAGATYEWDGDSWNAISVGGGGGAAQTPWAQNINGGGFNLSNVGSVTATTFVGNLTGAASLNVLSTNGTAVGLTLGVGGDGNVATLVSGANEANIVISDEGFEPGNFQASIGSYGINVGVGAYLKFDAAATDWAPILTGRSGASSPEGVITAPVGTHYWQTDVGEWVKNSGSGNTGWVQHTSIVE